MPFIQLTKEQAKDKVKELVNGNPDEIIFNGNINSSSIEGKAKAITFTDLSEAKTIEFLYPDKISPLNLPVVISPELSQFTEIGPIVCNNNGKCENEENYKNCKGK